MDTTLADLANSLTSGKTAAGFCARNEERYYAEFGGDWSRSKPELSRPGSTGFRAIATTFAVVILYCALVSYSPSILF